MLSNLFEGFGASISYFPEIRSNLPPHMSGVGVTNVVTLYYIIKAKAEEKEVL